MIEKDYNFNIPVSATYVFKEKNRDAEGNNIIEEYAAKCAFKWEDVSSIEEYAHGDDWEKYKGEKYFIFLSGQGNKLLLGSYQNMLNYWTMFRTMVPTFVSVQQDQPEQDPNVSQ